ncbi:alpha/beta fold hydrolase [Pelomonas sp. KK5]|uniref:alpha/beta fold hydrolase n=1 Tax=Pelomonas sp. KK5 TaxID=1855730 RepID=UPI00097C4188|nr:alpha/beta fold hydrolase [Pelomonas sp. KK5]
MERSPIPVGHFADIGDGLHIHYHEAGPADADEALILLHGSGAGASGYSNFKGNYPAFAAAGHRVIVPDLLGYGLSSKPEVAQFDLDFFVKGVKGLVDALGLKKVTLLGNSLGGAIALGYALASPDEVKALVLMAPGGIEELPAYFAMPGIVAMFDVYKKGLTGADAIREVMRLQLFDASLLSEQTIAERAPIAAIQTQAARSPMNIPNLTGRLHELRCPVFGFWGVNDQFTPPGGAAKLLAHCPEARIVMLNRCGHWVQVEHRGLFNRQCLDFLANG